MYYGRRKRYGYRSKGFRGYRRKRYYRKGKGRKSRRPHILRRLQDKNICPNRWFGIFRFQASDTWTTAGGVSNQVYRGNGPYDPEESVGGGQPRYFDQMMALYANYVVFSSSITVRVINMDAVPLRVGVIPSYINTDFTSINAVSEMPGGTIRLVGPSTGKEHTVIKRYAKTNQILTYKNVIDEVSLSGNSAGNPDKQWFWHVVLENIDAGDLNAQVEIEIKYYTLLYNREHIASS